MPKTFIIGSRGSDLATAMVADYTAALSRAFPDEIFDRKVVTTLGDQDEVSPLAQIEGPDGGSFTVEIDHQLRAGQIDLALHSLKDLPTRDLIGLVTVAPPARADARDAICGHRLADLPEGARVGTGSSRRAAQLRALRPDAIIVPMRGTVPPRFDRMEREGLDAVILAAAGLDRLGLAYRIAERLDPAVFPPAPAQGAFGLQVRENSPDMYEMAWALADTSTWAAVRAERSLLRVLNGGCSSPIGAYAVVQEDGTLHLRAQVTSPDGAVVLQAEAAGDCQEATVIGRTVAYELARQGAAGIVTPGRDDES